MVDPQAFSFHICTQIILSLIIWLGPKIEASIKMPLPFIKWILFISLLIIVSGHGEVHANIHHEHTSRNISSRFEDLASTSFSYTGGVQSWTVPSGVTSITVTLYGARGGDSYCSSSAATALGGYGGMIQSTIAVTPGEKLQIY